MFISQGWDENKDLTVTIATLALALPGCLCGSKHVCAYSHINVASITVLWGRCFYPHFPNKDAGSQIAQSCTGDIGGGARMQTQGVLFPNPLCQPLLTEAG